jgi:hypothetical protein
MTTAERFARGRPRLLRLAYSELGDVGEAEDVVRARADFRTGLAGAKDDGAEPPHEMMKNVQPMGAAVRAGRRGAVPGLGRVVVRHRGGAARRRRLRGLTALPASALR